MSVRWQSCAFTPIILDHFHHLLLPKHTPTSTYSPFPLKPSALGNHKSTFCFYRFAYSGYFIKMESYDMWSFVSGFFHLVFRVHPCGRMYQHSVPFSGQIIFHSMNIPHFVYPTTEGYLDCFTFWLL